MRRSIGAGSRLDAAGKRPSVNEPVALRARNWPALVALWVLGATWLGLIATFVYAEGFDNEPPSEVGWTLLGIGTAGFVLSLGGLTLMRTRGETALAFAALALALSFTAVTGPFFFYGFGS
jgi:hypothetical protein